MAAIKRPRETRNGRFWMLIELKKSCIGESDAGNQTPFTATKPRNARCPAKGGDSATIDWCARCGHALALLGLVAVYRV